MPRKELENFAEYKKRVIDAKSASFCGAKWLNACIWLGAGTTSSCHLPPAHAIDLDEIKKNPAAIHNTSIKKTARAQMQRGERPAECDSCWKIEDMQNESLSDRVFKTHQFSDDDLQAVFLADPQEDAKLVSLEIGFDRTCQLACSYCSSNLSSSWLNDLKQNGVYKNLISDGAPQFAALVESESKFSKEENPYIEAFWKWWPELRKSLKVLRVTGGEPLLSADFWKLTERMIDEQNEMAFAVNTNLMVKKDLIRKLIEKSRSVRKMKIFTSAEAFEKQAEYIRHGLDYSEWKQNLLWLGNEGKIETVTVMMTINALCLFSIIDFLNDVMKMKSLFKPGFLQISVNILRFPSFQSPLVLSAELRQDFSRDLSDWCDQNFHSQFLKESEKEGLVKLTHYLTDVKTPHSQASPVEVLRSDFKNFYQQYDQRRGYQIKDVFGGRFAEWYRQL